MSGKRNWKVALVAIPALAAMVAPQLAYAQALSFPLPNAAPQIQPTDTTGPGGGLGRAQGLRQLLLGPDRNTLPDSHGMIVVRDPRYVFGGQWIPFNSVKGVAMVPGVRTLGAVLIPVESAAQLDDELAVSAVDRGARGRNGMPLIMPSANTELYRLGCNKMELRTGATLVKATREPVYVVVPVGKEMATVRLRKNAMAMISAFDGHLVVSNLTDDGQDSVMVYLTDSCRRDYGFTPVRIGFTAEIYPNCACPENEVVAYTVLSRVPLSNGLTVSTMRTSYPRLLKRYNLTASLPSCDLQRVIKSAAAVSYNDMEREWNGLMPPVD